MTIKEKVRALRAIGQPVRTHQFKNFFFIVGSHCRAFMGITGKHRTYVVPQDEDFDVDIAASTIGISKADVREIINDAYTAYQPQMKKGRKL